MAHGLLGKENTHGSVGDTHRYHGADKAVGSSSQDLANPAFIQLKHGVRDGAMAWKTFPLTRAAKLAWHWGNSSASPMVLSEHTTEGWCLHTVTGEAGNSLS